MNLDIKQIQRLIRETQDVIKYTEDLLSREKLQSSSDTFKINRYLKEENKRLSDLTNKLNEAFRQLKFTEESKGQTRETIRSSTLTTMKNEIVRMYTHKEVFDQEE